VLPAVCAEAAPAHSNVLTARMLVLDNIRLRLKSMVIIFSLPQFRSFAAKLMQRAGVSPLSAA
jgi:hypothetical protein